MNMNVKAGENSVRYVFAVASSNNKHVSNKVRMENMHPSAVGHIIRRKKIAELQDVAEETKETNNDNVELTIISANETELVVDDALDNENMVDGQSVSKKRKTEDPGERSASKSKIMLTNDHLVVRSNSMGNFTRQSPDGEDEEYCPLNNYRVKSVPEEMSERRQGKFKVFRDEWLEIDIFRDWLDRDPTNPRKARCMACNTIMNAGKSELEKHAAGARHERAVEAMHQAMLQQLAAAHAEGEQDVEVLEDEDSSNETRQIHSVSLDGTTQPLVMEQAMHHEETTSIQMQQLEAINRVASAIESLSGNMCTLVERLAGQQSELISVLHALQKKICADDKTD